MQGLETLIKQQDRLYDLLNKNLRKFFRKNKKKSKKSKKECRCAPVQDRPVVEEELMTVKMAASEMNVSRSTIYNLINQEKLTKRKNNGKTRLIKGEVMAAKIWYSIAKGKI